MTDLLWFVAHTKPRCEKKLVQFCTQEAIATTLPLFKSVRKYRGKTVTFHKPLFPGYVFLKLTSPERQKVYQSKFVANLLEVFDQEQFKEQLEDILLALETDLDIRLAPDIGVGARVLIKSGPLQGMEGWVENRYGSTTVLLRLDFIGQAAAITVSADQLEPA